MHKLVSFLFLCVVVVFQKGYFSNVEDSSCEIFVVVG